MHTTSDNQRDTSQTTESQDDIWLRRIDALERMARECALLGMPGIRDFLRARAREMAETKL